VSVASIITSIVTGGVGDAFQKIVGAFKVPPEQALAAQVEIEKIQLEMQGKLIDQITAQIEVDKVEASSKSVFVAGWRPAIGWICGAGLATQFIIGPMSTWIAALAKHPIAFPPLDLGSLMTLLLGMLGLGAMRTVEKVNAAPGTSGLK